MILGKTVLSNYVAYLSVLKVNCKLRELAVSCSENTSVFNKLADQTEDFAVQLIDQVHANEELVDPDVSGKVDRYVALLSGLTDDAIIHAQKKVSNLFDLDMIHLVPRDA